MTADHLASVDELLDEALRNATDAEVRYAIRSAQQHLVAVSRDPADD
ncbi:hypothetical protein [Halorubrum sp. SY-15]|jgi:hypothetical protein